MSSSAETRKVAALIQYARSGPDSASSAPPITGPVIQAMFSTAWRSELAVGS
jgi:hypothetical protein